MTDSPAVTEMSCLSSKAEQVLDAAKRLFIQCGFGATSMDAIASAAGVSKATIYAHYNSKQALFAATARRECARVIGRMAIADDAEHLDLQTALTRIGQSFVQAILAKEITALLRMVISESARFPEIGQIYYESAPCQTRRSVTAYLLSARERGLIDAQDCDLAAGQFLGMLRDDVLIAELLGQTPQRRSRDDVVDEAARTFMTRYAVAPV